jgi:hypothetical protein
MPALDGVGGGCVVPGRRADGTAIGPEPGSGGGFDGEPARGAATGGAPANAAVEDVAGVGVGEP